MKVLSASVNTLCSRTTCSHPDGILSVWGTLLRLALQKKRKNQLKKKKTKQSTLHSAYTTNWSKHLPRVVCLFLSFLPFLSLSLGLSFSPSLFFSLSVNNVAQLCSASAFGLWWCLGFEEPKIMVRVTLLLGWTPQLMPSATYFANVSAKQLLRSVELSVRAKRVHSLLSIFTQAPRTQGKKCIHPTREGLFHVNSGGDCEKTLELRQTEISSNSTWQTCLLSVLNCLWGLLIVFW